MMGRMRGRVFAYTRPADLRKSFDTLAAVVHQELGEDPLSGDIFLFVNKRCDRAKILHFDGSGLAIYMKRMETGRFAAPWKGLEAASGAASVHLTPSELGLFLDGSPMVFLGRLTPAPPVLPRQVAESSLVV